MPQFKQRKGGMKTRKQRLEKKLEKGQGSIVTPRLMDPG